MQLVKMREHLREMPFDKFNSDDGFVHATGDCCQFEDGHWETEYEDCQFEDAPDCKEVWEEDEDEE